MKSDMNDFGFDSDFDFTADFEINNNFDFDANFETRYMKPIKVNELNENQLKYEKAEKLASELTVAKNSRQFVIVSGAFIFGDFIEAFIVKNNFHIKRMVISTLSMSQNNVDSLKNLQDANYIDDLEIIISTYFYAHERHSLIPYIYKQLDRKNKFQLAVADVHTKICIFETYYGGFMVIHGSANLRSSNCAEQIVIEENETLFKFVDEFHTQIIDKFKTINKTVRNKAMMKIINS